jgi:hypothetical protein
VTIGKDIFSQERLQSTIEKWHDIVVTWLFAAERTIPRQGLEAAPLPERFSTENPGEFRDE